MEEENHPSKYTLQLEVGFLKCSKNSPSHLRVPTDSGPEVFEAVRFSCPSQEGIGNDWTCILGQSLDGLKEMFNPVGVQSLSSVVKPPVFVPFILYRCEFIREGHSGRTTQ